MANKPTFAPIHFPLRAVNGSPIALNLVPSVLYSNVQTASFETVNLR
jgi:hypothetical protein